MNHAVPFAATLMLLATACSPDPKVADNDADFADMSQELPNRSVPAGAEMESMALEHSGAQAFIDEASSSDLFEIESAKIAQEKGTSSAVKSFAEDMIRDHTESTQTLKQAASTVQGLAVSPLLKPEQQSRLDALRNATADFDELYSRQQVAAHEKALALLRAYASSGDQRALTDFASKTADVVGGHLEMARNLPGA